MNKVNSVRELDVYQGAFALQQAIFRISKSFPKEERYSLTDQIRRSSRSVGANLSEKHRRLVGVLDKPEVWSVAPKPRKARLSQRWAKRRYPAHFLSKLTDADGELQETLHWLATAEACDYVDSEQSNQLREQTAVIGKQLGSMINRHESFCF